ncbi:MAG: ABC transporter permease, partial [Gemmatimonadales bacterium]
MDTLLQDLRYALRALRRSPGVTFVAVLTLTLGIGATTAIFSIVNAVLLQPLPYPAADRLAVLAGTRGEERGRLIAIADVDDWRARNRTFDDIGMQRTQSVNLTGSEAPERIIGSYVSANTLHLLGARAALGRLFTREEAAPGSGQRVTILSDAAWRTRFASDTGIVGRTLTLDGRPHRVIGVLSDGYRDPLGAIDVFLPIASAPSPMWFQRDNPTVWAYGRLKAGVTMAQAQEDLSRVARELAAQYPASNAQVGASVRDLRETIVGPVKATLLTVLGFVAVVLLIACANVANLQLARAAARAREISLRAALGAGRIRLVRQLLTESLVIAALGGAAGVLAATWGIQALVALVPGGLPTFGAIGLDSRVLAFSVAITVASGLLFGLAPALHAARAGLSAALQQRDAGVERTRRLDPRTALVAAQLALCIVLLIGAGLLTRSLRKLANVDPGFDPSHVLTAEFRLPRARYATDEAIVTFMTSALERIRAVPGVRDAALIQAIPLSGNWSSSNFVPDNRPGLGASEQPEA